VLNQYRKKIYGELAKLTGKTFLLSFFDLLALFGTFDHRKRYARAYDSYLQYRGRDYHRFFQLIYRLKTAELVEVYQDGKERFIILTKKGRQRIVKYLFQDGKVPIPYKWDGKWRMVIFDIPENLKATRNIVRDLLKRIGFYQLQKSVYVYPHECIGIVRYLEDAYDLDPYIQFVVAERIETEIDLIALFHERGVIKSIKRK